VALSLAKALASARGGTLTIAECLDVLRESEGKTSNANPAVGGHALQHSAMETGSSTGFRRIDDKYHDRGPLQASGQRNFKAEAPAITVKNQWGKDVKVPGPGEVTEVMVGSSHSQFTDDDQAALMLRLALTSKAGIEALAALVKDPTDSLTVTMGAPGGTSYDDRSSHLNAVQAQWKKAGDKFELKTGVPTPAQLASNNNFVLVNRKDMGSVVVVLRADGLGGDARLHVQTCYPQADAMGWGMSTLESTRTPVLNQSFLA
jgi:hypothetical protein